MQGLACAQILCKCSEKIARALVKGNIHILLFTLMYKDEEEKTDVGRTRLSFDFTNSNALLTSGKHYSSEDKDKVQECEFYVLCISPSWLNYVHIVYIIVFFQVGTDIIYTLSCVWDFKQNMLVTAIQDGMLEVSEVYNYMQSLC